MNYCPPPPPASGNLLPYQPQQQQVQQPQQHQQQQQISPCYWGPQSLPEVKVNVEINVNIGSKNWKDVLENQQKQQLAALGKDVVFRVLAPPLFANFPVQITIKDGLTVEDLINEVCKKTNNPREVIKGLRVHQTILMQINHKRQQYN